MFSGDAPFKPRTAAQTDSTYMSLLTNIDGIQCKYDIRGNKWSLVKGSLPGQMFVILQRQDYEIKCFGPNIDDIQCQQQTYRDNYTQ